MAAAVVFFWVVLGAGAKIFGAKVHPSLELRVFTLQISLAQI